MQSMFRDAYSFNSDLSGWDVSQVTDMSHFLDGAYSFNQMFTGWNTGKKWTDVLRICCGHLVLLS
jgi:surface protein